MSGEDQERFEDYLELERYIAELQAGGAPHLPKVLTARQVRIYHMVLLFRSLLPEGAEPRPTFVRALQARHEQELQQSLEAPPFRFLGRKGQKKPPSAPRRALLIGGAIAGASLMIRTCFEQVAEQFSNQKVPETTGSPLLNGPHVVWQFVAPLALLDDEALRFTTDTIVGYLWHDDETGTIIALSAACTHMGCLVQWHHSDRTFHPHSAPLHLAAR